MQRGDLYRSLLGQWGLPAGYWDSKPDAQLPLCPLAQRREVQAKTANEAAARALAEHRRQVREAGPVAYLEQHHPRLYRADFTPAGDLKNGDLAVTMATDIFTDRLLTGRWSSLGSAGFAFALSVITSSVSVLLIILHARRRDVQRSHNVRILRLRREFFAALRAGLNSLPTVGLGEDAAPSIAN